MSGHKKFQTPLAIFCLAFLIRVIFFLIAHRYYEEAWSPEKIGINEWLEIAQNFAAGKGFSHGSLMTYFPIGGGLEPTAARSPVPVLVLSAVLLVFGEHFYYALFVQSWMFSAASAALLYILAQKTLGSPGKALAVSLIYCFYLPEMYISTAYAAGSESLFTFLLMLYFYLVIRETETPKVKLALAAGVVFALAFLSKPVILFLPLLYMGRAVLKHGKKAAASIGGFMAVFILCVSPWIIRNQIVMGKPVLTTTLGGYNLLRHNWLISRGEYRLCTAEDFLPMVNQVIEESRSDMKALNEIRLNDLFTRKAKEIISEYPDRYLKLTAVRSVWLWYKIGAEKAPYLFLNILIYIFMFPGLVLVLARRHLLGFFAPHIFYFIFMHIGINAQFRFISPLMPYGIMIAFYMFAALFPAKRSTSSRC